ncbi:MAG TPA: ferredoxin--NADP reductase [Steroidobacteraceae bacterium]|nr:ferredoxin--NADP reductase [Steroidobacteraceae bacterium]
MAIIGTERVLAVEHWTDSQFTFRTTRDRGLRFENGQFVMVGLMLDRPLLRAYSIASANHDDHLEFLSIKVPDGPLTSHLQHVQPGDEVLVSRKPTGTLLLADLRPGRRVYLLCTGTGAAPVLSIIQDPELYARFDEVIIIHGVRWARETEVVRRRIAALEQHELLGEMVRHSLRYYPTVTREPHANRGRLTTLLTSGRLLKDLRLPPLDPAVDRLMVCGSAALLTDVSALLDSRGFAISPHTGEPGDYLIERAFVTRTPS